MTIVPSFRHLPDPSIANCPHINRGTLLYKGSISFYFFLVNNIIFQLKAFLGIVSINSIKLIIFAHIPFLCRSFHISKPMQVVSILDLYQDLGSYNIERSIPLESLTWTLRLHGAPFLLHVLSWQLVLLLVALMLIAAFFVFVAYFQATMSSSMLMYLFA